MTSKIMIALSLMLASFPLHAAKNADVQKGKGEAVIQGPADDADAVNAPIPAPAKVPPPTKAATPAAPPASAETTSSMSTATKNAAWEGLRTWLTHLKEGLAKSAVEQNYQNRSLSAVAAVRGAEQKLDDPNKPYIIDPVKSKAAKNLRQEKVELSAAVDLLLAGKTDEGMQKLDEFEKSHPKSSLLPEVREARAKVKASWGAQ